jgi:hypothetical protein
MWAGLARPDKRAITGCPVHREGTMQIVQSRWTLPGALVWTALSKWIKGSGSCIRRFVEVGVSKCLAVIRSCGTINAAQVV